ncbi:hypothetical protein [Geminicoccus harenae]|uniref:hypothetical protein n=1 Tax=Geminicoccus harenae TaxID=2498453 RepID=UPI001C9827AF|nr:hypothetical protein [Geminicoccus harenae]
MIRRARRAGFSTALLLSLLLPGLSPAAEPGPIANGVAAGAAGGFSGRPASPRPLAALAPATAEPAIGAQAAAGPLGGVQVVGSIRLDAACGEVSLDRKGRVLAVCTRPGGTTLNLLDPGSLTRLAELALPDGPATGAHYVNQAGRIVVLAGGSQVWLVQQVQVVTIGAVWTRGTARFEQVAACDLKPSLPAGDQVTALLPQGGGRAWFVSAAGLAGTLHLDDCTTRTLALTAANGASATVDSHPAVDPDEGALFLVAGDALQRLDAGADGQPVVSWRRPLEAPQAVAGGPGAVPVRRAVLLLGGQMVALTDGGWPHEQLVVFDRSRQAGGQRICSTPLFAAYPFPTRSGERLLGVAWQADGQASVLAANLTGGRGLERIDIDARQGRCETVWNSTVGVAVVPALSLENGLVYSYEHLPDGNRWALTTLDFATGRIQNRRIVGTGPDHAGSGAITLGKAGAASIGVAAGMVRVQDQNAGDRQD